MKSSWVFQSGCGEIWIEGLVKFNATALQTTQVGGFVIGNTLSPTTPEDPNPFKCNHADCRETSFSFGQLIGIQELGPGAKPQRAFGEFHHRLMQKFRASPAKLHQTLFATLLLHRRHTCSTEQIQGAGPIGALRAEQSCQTWCQDGAGARQCSKKTSFAVLLEDRLDVFVVILDLLAQGVQQLSQPHRLQLQRLDNGAVFRQSYSSGNTLQPLLNPLFGAAIMLVEERSQGRRFNLLHRRQVGPSSEELTGRVAIQTSLKKIHHQRIVALEHSPQLVERAGISIYKTAPSLDEQSQGASGRVFQLQRPQTILMFTAHFTKQLCVARIGFGSTDAKRPSKIGETTRIDTVEDQKVVLHQCIDECASSLLDAHAHTALGILPMQIQEESIQQFRLMLQRAGARAGVGANGQDVDLVGPISADPNIKGRRGLRVGLKGWFVHSRMCWASRKDLAGRKPYRGPITRQPLSVRIRQRKLAGSVSLSRCICKDMGRVIRQPSRVTPFFKRNAELFTSSKSAVAKVIHIGCGELPRASSPMLNNFWISYKGQGEGGLNLRLTTNEHAQCPWQPQRLTHNERRSTVCGSWFEVSGSLK